MELVGSAVPARYGLVIPRRKPWPTRRIRLRWPVLLATSCLRLREPQNTEWIHGTTGRHAYRRRARLYT
eukprot:scaffold11298_cov174-Isochrysis_galbana.AAC.1